MSPFTAIVVMGVSGSGKSTVARLVAERLGGDFIEADDFHPLDNRARMRSGIALTDDDRWPWLEAVGAQVAAQAREGRLPIVACSALKRRYRDTLRSRVPLIFFAQLEGTRLQLASRLDDRTGHFMPAMLLDSQLRALEGLESDEYGEMLSITGSPTDVVARVCSALAEAHPVSSEHAVTEERDLWRA